MCGRAYSTFTEEELQLRYLHRKGRGILADLKPNYNLAPTQLAPVVLAKEGELALETMRFGLVPAWTKSLEDIKSYSLINAKSEEIATKRSFSGPFKTQRCIVPLSGFFEWRAVENGPKRPYAIHLKDQPIMSVAGVYERWKDRSSDQVISSFAILTTRANSVMAPIHNRMPVILPLEHEGRWLDPRQDVRDLESLLAPLPADQIVAYEVSRLVNSPRNNVKEVLLPLGEDAGPGG